jgi:hypothetical protein
VVPNGGAVSGPTTPQATQPRAQPAAHADALWILVPAGQRASGEFIDDTLRERAEEKGMTKRLSMAADFPRQRVEVVRGAGAYAEVNERFYRRGWTDGLPITPPTLEAVDAMLLGGDRSRNDILGELDPLKGLASAEKVAANAVMAGCTPEHFPVVLRAVEALVSPEFNLRGVQTTDENVAPLLILSGPQVERLEVNDSFGALGPGWRGNASIGRAVRFIMNNLGGGWPGAVSFAGLGHPGRYSLCFAENQAANPWDPLQVDLGFGAQDTVLTVMRAESVINVTGGLPEIANVMGSAASGFSMARGGKVAVALAPFTARSLAEEGWNKGDVRTYLHEHGRLPVSDWDQMWVKRKVVDAQEAAPWLRDAVAQGRIPAVESPEDIVIVVAGGDVPIAQHAYFPTWGHPACCISSVVFHE